MQQQPKEKRRLSPRRLVAWSLAGCGGLCVASAVLLALALRLLPFNPDTLFSGAISSRLLDRHGRLLRIYLADDDQWRIAVALDEISPWAVKATLAAEDRRFFRHCGVDPLAIVRAAWQNLRHGCIVSGGSTITMQVVGLADSRERTMGRKLRQVVRALQLERCRTKEQILELYFTNAPYGGNICGIEAASWRYFGKPSRDLTAAEAALLAGIPQAPNRLRPDRYPQAARSRAQRVLARMRDCGFLSADDYRRAVRHLPEIYTAQPPMRAPHFTDYVHARLRAHPLVRTTLDLTLEQRAEALLRQHLNALSAEGVTNGAIVVLDNASGDVLAMVGSADYWDVRINGQVNGALSPRSPGSTLKPFIYGLALERGLVLPTSRLPDVPGLFTNYDPRNFDKDWRGLVRMDEALAWSLNIPAMVVLDRVGPAAVLDLMDAAGVRRVMPPRGDLGLTLAVGTCSVPLIDLANAYATLARGGLWKPWRVALPPQNEAALYEAARRWNQRLARERGGSDLDPVTSTPAVVLSPETCYLINAILSDTALRDPADVALSLHGVEGIAWKTGTSNGLRDAWTVAYDRDYTVGVWLGNFDGKPSPALVGGRVAAPLALELLQEVRCQRGAPGRAWPTWAGASETVTLCAESGEVATDVCPTTSTARLPLGIAQRARHVRCTVHRRVLVDAATGAAVCSRCMAGRSLKEIVLAEWPPAVEAWLITRAGSKMVRPPHLEECPSVLRQRAPRITAPHDGETFLLTGFLPTEFQQLRCEAVAEQGVRELHWFVDGEFVGSLAPQVPLMWPLSPGQHELRCVDDLGRASRVQFFVREEFEPANSAAFLE